MTIKQIVVSDISGAEIAPGDHVTIVVRDYPGVDAPVELDISRNEAAIIESAALAVVTISMADPSGAAHDIVVDSTTLDRIFGDLDVVDVLRNARRNVEGSRSDVSARAHSERPDYTSVDFAGTPHRGRITAAEKHTVWANLAQVNSNLEARGYRTIDPDNHEHRRRYGPPT